MTATAERPRVRIVYPSDEPEIPRPNLAAALAYAARGWPVVPCHTPDPEGRCSCGRADCHAPGKHPRTPHGSTDATTDPDQIRTWYETWPTSNVQVRTGGGIVVLDVDPRHGGVEWLRKLQERHGPLLVTATVETGGGGGQRQVRRVVCGVRRGRPPRGSLARRPDRDRGRRREDGSGPPGSCLGGVWPPDDRPERGDPEDHGGPGS